LVRCAPTSSVPGGFAVYGLLKKAVGIRLDPEQVTALTLKVAELEARLAQNRRNSGKPPSSDGLNRLIPKSFQRGLPFCGMKWLNPRWRQLSPQCRASSSFPKDSCG
jgi:hypothetical protein